MNFQVLRGAIFTFVDGLEDRLLELSQAGKDTVDRAVQTVLEAVEEVTLMLFEAGYHLVTVAIEESFSLFRAGLAVILGRPAEDEEGN